MQIEWKPIEGFEGLYEVSNTGEVKSLERTAVNNGGLQKRKERILKQRAVKQNGHCVVVLCKDGKTYPKFVHRLVAIAFLPNPENKPVVDHIDTNPLNNRADNLRWATVQENALNPLTRLHNSQSKMGHRPYLTKHTEEAKAKMSAALKGKKASEATKAKLSKAHKESAKSMEASMRNLQKACLANTGRKPSEETKQKIREKLTGVHKGKHWKMVNGKRVWQSE